jgi:hypothetical protein
LIRCTSSCRPRIRGRRWLRCRRRRSWLRLRITRRRTRCMCSVGRMRCRVRTSTRPGSMTWLRIRGRRVLRCPTCVASRVVDTTRVTGRSTWSRVTTRARSTRLRTRTGSTTRSRTRGRRRLRFRMRLVVRAPRSSVATCMSQRGVMARTRSSTCAGTTTSRPIAGRRARIRLSRTTCPVVVFRRASSSSSVAAIRSCRLMVACATHS